MNIKIKLNLVLNLSILLMISNSGLIHANFENYEDKKSKSQVVIPKLEFLDTFSFIKFDQDEDGQNDSLLLTYDVNVITPGNFITGNSENMPEITYWNSTTTIRNSAGGFAPNDHVLFFPESGNSFISFYIGFEFLFSDLKDPNNAFLEQANISYRRYVYPVYSNFSKPSSPIESGLYNFSLINIQDVALNNTVSGYFNQFTIDMTSSLNIGKSLTDTYSWNFNQSGENFDQSSSQFECKFLTLSTAQTEVNLTSKYPNGTIISSSKLSLTNNIPLIRYSYIYRLSPYFLKGDMFTTTYEQFFKLMASFYIKSFFKIDPVNLSLTINHSTKFSGMFLDFNYQSGSTVVDFSITLIYQRAIGVLSHFNYEYWFNQTTLAGKLTTTITDPWIGERSVLNDLSTTVSDSSKTTFITTQNASNSESGIITGGISNLLFIITPLISLLILNRRLKRK